MSWDNNASIDWNFDTIKSTAAMGSYRSMIMSAAMDFDENEEINSPVGQESIDTAAATQGSDQLPALGGLGMNAAAAHSTLIIRQPRTPTSEDTPALETSGDDSSGENSTGTPETPSPNEYSSPPPYTGSMRATRKSSRAERNAINGEGTVLKLGDIGNGVDTIRPMKKVDAAGSLRLSEEFLGSLRRDGVSSVPTSPSKSSTHKRTPSEAAKAGRAVIDDVVIPILQKVSFLISLGSSST